MKQRQREQVQRGCAVGTVVLLAWLCRVLPLEGMALRPAGSLRHPPAVQPADVPGLPCPLRPGSAIAEGAAPAGVGSRSETPGAPGGAGCQADPDRHQRLAGRPDAGRRHGAVLQRGYWMERKRKAHVLQVPALNPNPQRPRANAPLTLWGHASHSFVIPPKVTSQNLLLIAIP